ncbi:hypothetical protein SUDANB95_06597 [Actinosynnema sp. ALI-1.44]
MTTVQLPAPAVRPKAVRPKAVARTGLYAVLAANAAVVAVLFASSGASANAVGPCPGRWCGRATVTCRCR